MTPSADRRWKDNRPGPGSRPARARRASAAMPPAGSPAARRRRGCARSDRRADCRRAHGWSADGDAQACADYSMDAGHMVPRAAPHVAADWQTLEIELAQPVIVVAAGMLDQIVLVILLGAHPGRRRLDPRDDRPVPLAGLVDPCLDRLGGLALRIG